MEKSPPLAFLYAWLLPGAGHWYVGQRGKAVTFFVILVGLFLAGTLITKGGCVNIDRHPYGFILQAADGPLAAVTLLFTAHRSEFPASSRADFGMLLTLVSGALNVLLIADALYRSAPAPEAEGKQ